MLKNSSALLQNKIYFGGLLVALCFAILFIIFYGNDAAFISANSSHPFYLNVFFINYTFMGDGIFAICLVAIVFFYFKRKRLGFALLCSFLISGIAIQVIKNLVSSTTPKFYFEAGTYLRFLDGTPLNGDAGSLSGHTATAFALTTVIVLMFKNKNLQLLILMAAILLSYSRMYLAQHFLLDIIGGALLGTVSGILAFYLAQNRVSIKWTIKKMHRLPSGPVSSPNTIQTI